MKITDIRIRRIFQENRLRALVSVTLDNDFAIHDIKVVKGPQRLFVAMPSRKDENGVFRDIAHPITPQAREMLEDSILEAYYEYLKKQPDVELPSDIKNQGASAGIGSSSSV